MPTLSEALLTFLQVDRSQHTNRQYAYVLKRLSAHIGPQRDVTLIRYEDLVDYFARLRQTGVKPVTVHNHLTAAKSFFTWCLARGYIQHSPAVGITVRLRKEIPSRRTKPVPPDELVLMIDAIRLTQPRNYALLLFLADTGCRVGGAAKLELPNLDLEEGCAQIEEKGQRLLKVFFGDQTAAALAAWIRKRPPVKHSYVWTGVGPHYNPLQPEAISAMIRRLSERLDLPQHWTPHNVRHSVGHAMAKRGVPVTITQKKLGHSNPSITMAYYYPDEEDYLIQVSRRHALAALEEEHPEQPKKPFVVPKKGTG